MYGLFGKSGEIKSKGLIYCRHSKKLLGYVDLGNGEQTMELADQGFIFQVKSIFSKWKQPVFLFYKRLCSYGSNKKNNC